MMPDLPKFAQYLLDLILWIPRKIYELFTDAIAAVIDTICGSVDLSWWTTLSDNISNIPSGVKWFAAWFHFGYGMTIIFTALFLRFLLRRIPLFG